MKNKPAKAEKTSRSKTGPVEAAGEAVIAAGGKMSKKAKEPETPRRRIVLLDDIRGFAVLCMVFYHAFFLWAEVFDLSSGVTLLETFEPLEPFFAGVFIVISGISCRLSRNNALRGVKLLGVALALTGITALLLPRLGFKGTEIYFGILHLLSISMLVFSLLRPLLNKIRQEWGMLICLILYALTVGIGEGFVGIKGILSFPLPQSLYELSWLFPLGIPNAAFRSADYFPLIPNLFLFLAGTYLGIYVKLGRTPKWAYKGRVVALGWLGRNALLVYITHVPVIFALTYITLFIVNKFIPV